MSLVIKLELLWGSERNSCQEHEPPPKVDVFAQVGEGCYGALEIRRLRNQIPKIRRRWELGC